MLLKHNKEVATKEGVVYTIEENNVVVKFDVDVFVNFPSVLFKNISNLDVGMHLKYKIIRDINGLKWQEFEVIEICDDHKDKSEIIKQLNSFLDK